MTELRAAFHRLRRSPGFVLGASLSLAIGISLATAVYSVMHSILNRPIGVTDADRVGMFVQWHPTAQQPVGVGNAKIFMALRERGTALAAVAASEYRLATIGHGADAQRVSGYAVTRNILELEQVRPMLGRGFGPEDEGQHVVILGYSIWTTRFGSDTGIVGQEIAFKEEGARHRVIGVLPPSAEAGRSNRLLFLLPESVITNAVNERDGGDGTYLSISVRLATGVSFAQADAQVASIYKDLYRDDPLRSKRSAIIAPLRGYIYGGLKDQLEIWGAAAILVLLLCAVNFATMSLSRGMRRRGEIAVRAAMGATRGQIARSLLSEALLLSLAGGALAALFGWWLVSYSSEWFAGGDMVVQPVMDTSVVAFAVVGALVVGFIFAGAPALELAKVDLRSVLQGEAASSSTKRGESFGRRALVGLQLCLALTAVACVTALTQADRRSRNFAANYDYERVVFAFMGARDGRSFPFDVTPVMDAARASPGVERVAAQGRMAAVIVWDRAGTAVDFPRTYVSAVTPNIFDVMGVRLAAGRLPTEDEQRAGDAVVISEPLALRLAGSAEAATGLRIRMKRGLGSSRDWVTVTGVVPDVGGAGMGLNASVFVLEDPRKWYFAWLVMRVNGDVKVRAKELERSLDRVDSRLAPSGVRSAQSLVEAMQASTRGRRIFLAVTTALSLALAVIGVYGLTSYTTELRMREFGIRIALGASAPRLTRLIIGDLWWMALVGIVVGFYAAGEVTTFLDTLYRPAAMKQPLVTLPIVPTLASGLTLVMIAFAGTIVPLRRVLRLDVMRTVQGSG
jgi:putative ABC transport system permease protein